MNDYNKIIGNYKNIYPSFFLINSNSKSLKNPSHIYIFSYLLGYFSHINININDFKPIFEEYKNDAFDRANFFNDFKKITNLFCNFFENKNNNSNNNSQYDLINNNNSNNNFIENSIHFSKLNINSNNPNNNNQSQNFFGLSHSEAIHQSINNNSNRNINNSNWNINNSNYNINNSNRNLNNIYDDYKLAKQLEEEEKAELQIQQEKDALNQKKKCEICLEEFSLLDCTNYFLNCNCILHNKCFDEMVKAAVENNTLPVKCPNCGIPVHPNFIEDSLRNVNPQLWDKYERFSMNNFIQNNSDEYSSCPTPGCEYMFFFNPGEFNFLCPLCQKNYCLNCKDEWHTNMTCQQYRDSRDVNKLDNQFFEFVKGAKFKMCPRCKYWVEKNQGCNHMKCRCGADFCYLCGALMDMSRRHKCH